jgi:hypothetical protein
VDRDRLLQDPRVSPKPGSVRFRQMGKGRVTRFAHALPTSGSFEEGIPGKLLAKVSQVEGVTANL